MHNIQSAHDTTVEIQSLQRPLPEYSPTLFTAHQLRPDSFHITPATKNPPDWILVIILICLALIAWTHVFYSKRIQQMFKAPFSQRNVNQLLRDGDIMTERFTLTYSVVYILMFSLLLYEINLHLAGFRIRSLDDLTFFGILNLLVIGYYTLKMSLIWFLGTVFKTRETTLNYQINLMIISMIAGPVLLIFMIPFLFISDVKLLYLNLLVAGLLLLFRFVRGFFIGMNLTKFSYLFLFVYLCSLEILPVFILVKLLLIF